MLPLGHLQSPIDWQNPLNKRHVLARGLQAWWLAHNAQFSGVTWFDITRMRPATLMGMSYPPTSTSGRNRGPRPGGFGMVSFDSSDDYVTAGTNSVFTPSNAISVSYWFRIRTLENNAGLVGTPNGGLWTQGWGSYTSLFPNHIFWIETWNANFVTFTVAANTTYHFVGTWDGSTIRQYVNGVQQSGTDTYAGAITGGNPLEFGRLGSNSFNVDGWIDDIMIWDRALSPKEVMMVYTSSRLGHPSLLRRSQLYKPTVSAGAYRYFFLSIA